MRRRAGAQILAEFAGYGLSEDAFDMVAPEPGGQGATECMRIALRESGLGVGEIDWIVAHGTGTILNDKAETVAIKRIFGQDAYDIPITSIKSSIGHAMGAAGRAERSPRSCRRCRRNASRRRSTTTSRTRTATLTTCPTSAAPARSMPASATGSVSADRTPA